MVDVLAVPVHLAARRARERFAGAIRSWTLRGDDGRRQGAADGHQPRARPELRQGVRHPVLLRRPGEQVYVWQTSWGVVDPADRGADHGPRRRRRLAAAAPAGAHPGRGRPGPGRGRRPAAAAEHAGRRPAPGRAPGRASTTGSTPPSGGGPSTGSSRACRCGSRSGPATWPSGHVTVVRRDAGTSGRCRWRMRRRAGRRRPRRRPRTLSSPRRRERRDASAPRGAPPSTRRSRRPRPGSPSFPGDRSASEGETRLAASGVSVRCLQRADGGLAAVRRRARPGRRGRPGLLTRPAPVGIPTALLAGNPLVVTRASGRRSGATARCGWPPGGRPRPAMVPLLHRPGKPTVAG